MHIHFLCMFINSIYVISFFLVFEISKANIMKSQISNISELFSGFKVHVKLAFLGQWHSATSVQCSDSGDYSRLKLQNRLKIFFAVNLFVSCVCVCVGFPRQLCSSKGWSAVPPTSPCTRSQSWLLCLCVPYLMGWHECGEKVPEAAGRAHWCGVSPPSLHPSVALLRQTLSGGSKRAIDVFLGVEIENPSDTPHHVDPCHSETNTCVFVCLCVCVFAGHQKYSVAHVESIIPIKAKKMRLS